MREAAMRVRALAGLLLLAAASAVRAAPIPDRPAARPACEPYSDPREMRYRTPAAKIVGRIAPGSITEPEADPPEIGQVLVFGTADLIAAKDGSRTRISYAYWATADGCGGWEPAQGRTYEFDLADDKASDGALRVMQYGNLIGASR
jgi:hypothetical protein